MNIIEKMNNKLPNGLSIAKGEFCGKKITYSGKLYLCNEGGIVLTFNFKYNKSKNDHTVLSKFNCLICTIKSEQDIELFTLRLINLYNIINEIVDELCKKYDIKYYNERINARFRFLEGIFSVFENIILIKIILGKKW